MTRPTLEEIKARDEHEKLMSMIIAAEAKELTERIKKDAQINDVYYCTPIPTIADVVINESKWRTPEVSYRLHIFEYYEDEPLWYSLVRYGRTEPIIKSHDLCKVLDELYRLLDINNIQGRLFE